MHLWHFPAKLFVPQKWNFTSVLLASLPLHTLVSYHLRVNAIEVGWSLVSLNFGQTIRPKDSAQLSTAIWPQFGRTSVLFGVVLAHTASGITTLHAYFSSTTLVLYIFCIYLAFVHKVWLNIRHSFGDDGQIFGFGRTVKSDLRPVSRTPPR